MADHSAKVKDIIEKELGVEREKLTDEASFIEDLGADSLDIVELVMEFEKEFNIDIPDEDAEKLRTVGDAIKYLDRRSAPDEASGRCHRHRVRHARRQRRRDDVVRHSRRQVGSGDRSRSSMRSAWPVRFACELKGFDPLDVHGSQGSEARGSVHAVRDGGRRAGDERRGLRRGQGIRAGRHRRHHRKRNRRALQFRGASTTSTASAGRARSPRSSFRSSSPISRRESSSMRFHAKGPNYATVSACATSAHAIGDATRTIQYGDADVIIAGGSEAAVTPMSIGGFANMKALSERNESPATASRPFDATRDGFVMGEGAGIVILEELEHAKRRGARIYAEVRGTARPATRTTSRRPRPKARARSARCAARCKDAGIEAERRAVHQRARHVDAGQRSQRDQGHQGRVRRARRRAQREFDQSRRPATCSARRDRSSSSSARWRSSDNVHSADDQLRDAGPGLRPRLHAEQAGAAARRTSCSSNSFGFGGHNVCLAIRRFAE